MTERKRIFDDLAGMASGAISAFAGLREEVEALVRARLDEAVRRMQLVKKEEVEVLQDRIAALEARIATLEAAPAPDPR